MTTARNRTVKFAVLALFMALGWTVVYAFSTGPEPGFTNAPGDLASCVVCHSSAGLNSGNGQVTLTGAPTMYQPGQRYQLTLAVRQNGQRRWGFQLTVLGRDGNSIGQLTVTDALATRLENATIAGKTRTYLSQTQAGTRQGTTGGTSWNFSWTAPATDAGPATFYFVGNAANGDSGTGGDFIYADQVVSNSPGSQLAIRLIAPNGGETFTAGRPVAITWETTNREQAESHEVRLSTDGGATFPTRIAAALPPTAQSFTWNTPATLDSTTVRVRVSAFPQGGLPPLNAASAANFSVVPGPPPPPPPPALAISQVSPDSGMRGTRMTVKLTGTGFVAGSQVTFGPGIKIRGTEIVGATEINVSIRISKRAMLIPYDVRVTTPTGATTVRTAGFRVQ